MSKERATLIDKWKDYLYEKHSIQESTDLKGHEIIDIGYEFYQEQMNKIVEEIKEKTKEVSNQNPYKESGNRDSYRKYNEGWADGCDILEQSILEIINKHQFGK